MHIAGYILRTVPGGYVLLQYLQEQWSHYNTMHQPCADEPGLSIPKGLWNVTKWVTKIQPHSIHINSLKNLCIDFVNY